MVFIQGFKAALIMVALAPIFMFNVCQGAETSADDPPVHIAPQVESDEVGLHFHRFYKESVLIRPKTSLALAIRDGMTEKEAEARAIAQALVDGPTPEEKAQGYMGFLPNGTKLDRVSIEEPSHIFIYLDIPADFVTSTTYSERFVLETGEHFIESLRHLGYNEFAFFVKDPVTGGYLPIRRFLPGETREDIRSEIPPLEQKEPDSPSASDKAEPNIPTQNEAVAGSLSGKTIVLNQSHGWLDDHDGPNRWRIQRTLTWEVLEDYASAMFMNHYVIPMLQNAGARVRPARETDAQSRMVVVDNAMGSPSYLESGTGWFNSSLNGYVHKATFTGLIDNPFGNGGATRLVSGVTAIGSPTASATYTASIPATGYYNVYISYAAGTDRTMNAHWQVHHSGGVSDFRINQRNGGATWVLLGNYYFEAGAPAHQRKVVALNDNGDTNYLNVDAVRFGGGMGNVARRDNGVSGRPRWQEESVNYLQYIGAMASSLMVNNNDRDDEAHGWSNRARYAQWEQTRDGLGANLVYVGWHTNASGYTCVNGTATQGGGRGTGSYRDTTNVPDEVNASPATINFTSKVHNAFIASVKTYVPTWQDRGVIGSNNHGECSQFNLGNVAGFFFEGVFHDNTADANLYKDPKFRYVAARGIVKGIIDYYGGTVYPPEPVSNFQIRNLGNNQVRLEWTRGPYGSSSSSPIGSIPTKYRIYKSSNGYGFDDGFDTPTAATQYTMTLTPGETAFYRVVAVNNGGISIPSPTLAARVPTAGMPTLAIINGYLRNDRLMAPLLTSSGIGGCGTAANVYRTMDPRKFQSFDYTVQHAHAVAAKGGYGIDCFTRDAVKLSTINLRNYPIVLWIGGQEAEADTADNVDDTSLYASEQSAIASFLEQGGNLFISGSEIAWDLGQAGSTMAEKAFLNNYLKAAYIGDSSNTYSAQGTMGIFSGLPSFTYDNGSGSTYQVRFPDRINPNGGSTTAINYVGGTGGSAAIQYAGNFGASTTPGKIVYMGFGFETIIDPAMRNNLMGRVLDFFTPSSISDWAKFNAISE